LRDGLTLAASAVGEHSEFIELNWSGRNRASARQAAASELSRIVQHIRSTFKNESIFVIGHSHGGSAIAYFLKEYSSLAKALSGCAFLSTPFIAIRPRAQAVGIFSAVCGLFLWTVGGSYVSIYGYLFGIPYSEVISHPFVYYGFALVLALNAIFLLTLRKLRNPEALLEEAHRRQTAELPTGNYLFLRCSGDEAALGLSAAQFIVWSSMWFAQKVELIFGNEGTRKLSSRRRLVYLLLFALLMSSGTTPFPVEVSRDLRAAAEGQFALWLPLSALFYFALAAPYFVFVFGLAMFVIFVAQAFASWLFGWTGLTTGFLVELAIEPLPFGAHSLVHIDWVAGSVGLEGIVHSWTYAHPVAIMHLQNWVRESLEKKLPTMAPETGDQRA
jgi:Alpha/beta hydrolase of unknown function (DUF915)